MFHYFNQIINTIFETLLVLISPPFCVHCKKNLEQREPLCSDCEALIEPIVSALIKVQKYTVPVFALSAYKGVIQKLILAKHHSSRVAARQLGQLMIKHPACPWDKIDYVVPVPLHWIRYARRGFNQAEVMARVIVGHFSKKLSCGIKRSKKTEYQAQLTRDARKKNVAEVFVLADAYKESYYNKHILIIDDLMTTGVTLREVIALVAAGNPASITVLVAARVV